MAAGDLPPIPVAEFKEYWNGQLKLRMQYLYPQFGSQEQQLPPPPDVPNLTLPQNKEQQTDLPTILVPGNLPPVGITEEPQKEFDYRRPVAPEPKPNTEVNIEELLPNGLDIRLDRPPVAIPEPQTDWIRPAVNIPKAPTSLPGLDNGPQVQTSITNPLFPWLNQTQP